MTNSLVSWDLGIKTEHASLWESSDNSKPPCVSVGLLID